MIMQSWHVRRHHFKQLLLICVQPHFSLFFSFQRQFELWMWCEKNLEKDGGFPEEPITRRGGRGRGRPLCLRRHGPQATWEFGEFIRDPSQAVHCAVVLPFASRQKQSTDAVVWSPRLFEVPCESLKPPKTARNRPIPPEIPWKRPATFQIVAGADPKPRQK